MSGTLEQRMFELRLKMNKAKQLNNQAVVAEKRREADPKWFEKSISKQEAEGPDKIEEDEALLHATAESVAWKGSRSKPKEEKFAWDAFNQDTQYRAHEKRVNKLGFYADAYNRQKEHIGEDIFYAGSSVSAVGHKPSEDAKDRLIGALKVDQEKRTKFSRKREEPDGDVEWINEGNKRFTKQLERSYGKYTKEIKANLERGTAI
jgi:hypothetical protein